MATIRIQVEINKGKRGVPLGNLSRIVGDLQKFLGMLAEDLNLPKPEEPWVGLDFTNGSLTFLAEKPEALPAEEVSTFNADFASIAERSPSLAVRRATVAQFARIADPIIGEDAVSFSLYAPQPETTATNDTDEIEKVGVVRHADTMPLRSFSLTKAKAEAIEAEIQGRVKAYGALQGRIHSIFIGAQPAYFNLRELSTGALVKCFYRPDIYTEIAEALQRRNAVLHVYGYTLTDLVQRKLEEMHVAKVQVAPVIENEEFDKLFGGMPKFTGRLTTQEFINQARSRG